MHIREFGWPEYVDVPRREILFFARPHAVQVNRVLYLIPRYMPFDGASIPRWPLGLLWRFFGPPLRGPYRRGAGVHDGAYKGLLGAYLCGLGDAATRALDRLYAAGRMDAGHLEAEFGPSLPVERAEADDLLRELAIWNGTSPRKARLMRWAVDRFGGPAWEREHETYRDWDGTLSHAEELACG